MIRFTTTALLLLTTCSVYGREPGPAEFRVPADEVLLHRFERGAVLAALPGAAGRLLADGLELTDGAAVLAWTGTFTVNAAALACDIDRCQRILGSGPPDAVAALRRILLLRRDLPLDLEELREELNKEEAAFTETGVVSVEAGSVCLDAGGADGGGVSGMETPQTRVEKTPATVRVKVKFD